MLLGVKQGNLINLILSFLFFFFFISSNSSLIRAPIYLHIYVKKPTRYSVCTHIRCYLKKMTFCSHLLSNIIRQILHTTTYFCSTTSLQRYNSFQQSLLEWSQLLSLKGKGVMEKLEAVLLMIQCYFLKFQHSFQLNCLLFIQIHCYKAFYCNVSSIF